MFQALDDTTAAFGQLISVELFRGLANNINALLLGMPVGSIVPILYGIPGVPYPDSNIWQLCDGSEILHPTSPLRSVGSNQHFAPNYADLGRYIRAYDLIGNIGNYGGENVKNLSHSHGGATATFSPPTEGDRSSDHWTVLDHHHSISPDLGSYNFEPPHFRILHFIKIN